MPAIAPIKARLPEHEPGLVDKLVEVWKLFGAIKRLKMKLSELERAKESTVMLLQ